MTYHETLDVRGAAVIELHRKHSRWNRNIGRPWCLLCNEEWPCQTVRILDDSTSYTNAWLTAHDVALTERVRAEQRETDSQKVHDWAALHAGPEGAYCARVIERLIREAGNA